MTKPTPRACKGCGSTTKKLTFPGPRCRGCGRVEKARISASAHESRMARIYGLSPGDYQRLYRAQGGRCWICRRATGRTKRLAVDHDHDCTQGHARTSACKRCVRGLLCGPCNTHVVGRLSAEGLQRAYWYLLDPPAAKVLAQGLDVYP